MDEALINRALLAFFGACLLGPLSGALLGWRKGFESGIALGCLVIGLTGLAMAGWVAMHRYASIAGTEPAQGRLVDFVEETSKDAKGRRTTTLAPLVEFAGPDGRLHQVKGLGGSRREVGIGEAVEVRYRSADPSQALVADFQNLWGPVLALGIFGLFPTLFGLFFVGVLRGGRSGRAAPREATPAQQKRRTALTVVANVVFLGGFVITFLGEDVARSLGAGFMTIGGGALLHFVAQSLPPAASFQPRFILVIVGLGFVVFGASAWVLAG
ncbi:DUF3592 domain-containing protein [Variovorax sp. JS1663]|uniref:DUF3592 domain-containing protein n=1 Tax=Variovorax sp. JS1663 TaxID=1851577 RepID=UPI000B348368|nr:DUF3592 domain-containing protein [Variovorax sp. JS1663]OUL98703.1 hypothetical protein A8M77_30305 [Variovorax sp. JS1663]